MGPFERFKTKTHFNLLKRLVGSWLLVDWDAIRLPTGITAPR